MGGTFETSRAGGISSSQVQPRLSLVEAGKGGPRVGEPRPSCLAGSTQVEVRSRGPDGWPGPAPWLPGGEFPERPLPES